MAFDTSLLDAALARRRAARERERRVIVSRVLRLLDELGPRYGIRRAYLFGSVARPGQFREESDVDIAVEAMDPELFFDAIATLSFALERDVDLIELRKCHFADRIRAKGILWRERPSRS